MQINTDTYTKFTVLITIVSSFQSFTNPQQFNLPRCEVPGMVGACPSRICPIIERLKEENERIKNNPAASKETTKHINLLILEGPTGVGKTKLAEAIAKETDSVFYEIYGADIIDSYIGGSKDNVNENIAKAIAKGEAERKRVIIFIDETDAVTCNDKSTARTEYDAALKALWRHADKNKHNLQVYFIFATNHLDRLPVEFRNRLSSRTISMSNPDTEQRKELLHHFSKYYTEHELKEYCPADLIEKLVKETGKFSVRNIEDLFSSAYEYASNKPITPQHIMYALTETKVRVEKQNEPIEEEREKQRTRKREQEQDELQRQNFALQQKNLELQRRSITMQSLSLRFQFGLGSEFYTLRREVLEKCVFDYTIKHDTSRKNENRDTENVFHV